MNTLFIAEHNIWTRYVMIKKGELLVEEHTQPLKDGYLRIFVRLSTLRVVYIDYFEIKHLVEVNEK